MRKKKLKKEKLSKHRKALRQAKKLIPLFAAITTIVVNLINIFKR
ncbi:hypothetical protein [Clostridium saccharobutylicum]|uniref:Uncharacterized protein n=1 Tax=Clostridium saccharobutylicum TaxID=169679 RepID=A0A1S8N5Y6_CLOSA|nr:hypothetical protein [Clostridium saccharobutylicum]OOM11803.1 hypothetical protein CLOSAC_22300 [Clostridium saccharobutylicum]